MRSILQHTDIPNTTRVRLLEMQEAAQRELRSMKTTCCDTFQKFWYGSEPVETQLAELGPAAGDWFDQHARTVQFLLESGVEMNQAEYLPPREYDRNQDGTITLRPLIQDDPPVEEETTPAEEETTPAE